MRNFLPFIAFLFLLSSCNSPTPALIPITHTPTQATETLLSPTLQPEPTATSITLVTLQRGINMGDMLEAPHEGDWGTYVQEEYFDLIKQAIRSG
jgi:hypothetical protein